MMKKCALACALALSLGVVGCSSWTEPVLTPSTTFSQIYSVADVRDAIFKACQNRNWLVTADEPGKISANLIVRSHQVQVDIPYSATGYTINYVSSVNMKAGGGEIHNKYNNWVNNLDHDIRFNLQKTMALKN